MTLREYYNKKNDITAKYTGIRIVPENQIVDMEFKQKLGYNASDSCPYCVLYQKLCEKTYETSCEGCPMDKAGNRCKDFMGSNTWSNYQKERKKLHYNTEKKMKRELRRLVDKWNKELKWAKNQ